MNTIIRMYLQYSKPNRISLKYDLALDSDMGGSPGTCITSPRSNNSKT